MEEERLAAMLAGIVSIDVYAAVRLSRALQLSAERIMQAQVRYDFAAARREPSLGTVGLLVPPEPPSFPDYFLRGHLARATDASGNPSYFFQEQLEHEIAGDGYAGLHALWCGDRLRVYAPAAGILWMGPVLHDLDGRVLLAGVRADGWSAWFDAGYRADLAAGADHVAFFERMDGA